MGKRLGFHRPSIDSLGYTVTGRFAPESVVGAEMHPRAVGESPLSRQPIDPYGDSAHMGYKNRMKPAVSDKIGRGEVPRTVPFTQNGFVREFV